MARQVFVDDELKGIISLRYVQVFFEDGTLEKRFHVWTDLEIIRNQ